MKRNMLVKQGFLLIFALMSVSALAGAGAMKDTGTRDESKAVTVSEATGTLDQNSSYEKIYGYAQRHFLVRDFDLLDSLLDTYIRSSEQFSSGPYKGMLKASAVYDGIYSIIFRTNMDWDQRYSWVKAYRANNPHSAGAVIIEASYWNQYAWHARGDGYGASISPEGAKLMEDRWRRGERVLEDSKSYASSYPQWYTVSLEVGLGLDYDKADLLKIFSDGTKRYPYYDRMYTVMIHALQPRWGGSYIEENRFILAAVDITKEQRGLAYYAQLYRELDRREDVGFDLFGTGKASWPMMKQGFEDKLSWNPNSYDLNSFAGYACRAHDKDTFLNLVKRIGGDIDPGAYRSNYSYDVCMHMYTQKS